MAAAPPSIDSSKLLKAPEVFKGDEETWLEWSFVFRNYCLGLDAPMVQHMNEIVASGVEVSINDMTDVTQSRARNLMALLSSYCRSKAQRVLRNMKEPDNGFNAWLELNESMLANTPQQRSAILRTLLKWDFKGDFKARMIEFEIEVTLFDRLGGVGEDFPDSIKMAVLIEGAPAKLREHLQVNSERYTTYAQVRSAVTSFLATRKAVTQTSHEDSNDMQVDALGKGGGKNGKKGGKTKHGKKGEHTPSNGTGVKGKTDKGKGKKGGKTPSAPFAGYCGFCGIWGHMIKDCRKNPANNLSGKPGVSALAADGGTGTAPQTNAALLFGDEPEDEAIHQWPPPPEWEEEWEEEHPSGWIMALCAAAGPAIGSPTKQWVLVDTGSDITACGWDFGQGADTSAPTRRLDLKNVSGTAIEHYGERAVRVKLTDTEWTEHPCTMNFDVAEVATPVMSVGKSSDNGFGLWIPPYGGQPVLIRGGSVEVSGGNQIPLTRYNNVYYMEVDIQPPTGSVGLVVAAQHAEADFHAGMEPFDQDLEENFNFDDDMPAALVLPANIVDLEAYARAPAEPAPVIAKVPASVSAEQISWHRVTGHAEYKDWCEHCVMSKGRERPHRRLEEQDGDIPIITCDYSFLSFDKAEEARHQPVDGKTPTVLCAADRRSGACFSVQVLTKGPSVRYGPKAFAQWIDRLGYKRVRLRCDPEPALKAAARATIKMSQTTEIVLETVPTASHATMGVGEQIHQLILGKVRILKSEFESLTKVHLPPAAALVPWIVRHAGWIRNRFEKRPDGHTAHYNIVGVEYSGVVHVFGEIVLARLPATKTKKFTGKFVKAIWLGKAELSDEHIVGTASGAFLCRTTHRLPVESQFDSELYKQFCAPPWEPGAKGPGVIDDEEVGDLPAGPLPELASVAPPGLAPQQAEAPAPPGSPARAEAAGNETHIAEPGLAMGLAAPAALKRGSGGETPPAAWQRTSHARLDVDPEPRGAPRLAADEVEEELRAITKRVRHDDVISGLVVEEYLVCGAEGQTFDQAFEQAADLADQDTSDDLWEHPELQISLSMDEEKIAMGREKEMEKLTSFAAYEWVSEAEATDGKWITSRWEDQLRGDEVRSRWVWRVARSLRSPPIACRFLLLTALSILARRPRRSSARAPAKPSSWPSTEALASESMCPMYGRS